MKILNQEAYQDSVEKMTIDNQIDGIDISYLYYVVGQLLIKIKKLEDELGILES